MSDPGLTPETPLMLGKRHLRTVAGLVGMVVAVGGAVAIQVARAAHDAAWHAAILAKGCPLPAAPALPTVLQIIYEFVIPFWLPTVMFACGFLMFSPTLFGQFMAAVRSVLPWAKAVP